MTKHNLTIEQGGTSYSADVSAKNLKLRLPLRAQCSCGWSLIVSAAIHHQGLTAKLNGLNRDWQAHTNAAEANREVWLGNSTPWGDHFNTGRNDPLLDRARLRAYLDYGEFR